jgi:phosphoglycerate dehydrogenase-like enzyme
MSSTKRPKVLLVGSMYHKAGEELLAALADVHVLSDPDHEAILQAITTASAVWVRYPTRLGGDAIRKGRQLLVISTSGRGTDAVDIPEATERGIAVVNNPGLGIIPVSEHTVALMLDLAKQISRSDAAVRKGDGWANRDGASRISLEGRTVGLIGLGTIGTEVARKCIAAFHMRALAYDPTFPPAEPRRSASSGSRISPTCSARPTSSRFTRSSPTRRAG